jgi:hypothetical protein
VPQHRLAAARGQRDPRLLAHLQHNLRSVGRRRAIQLNHPRQRARRQQQARIGAAPAVGIGLPVKLARFAGVELLHDVLVVRRAHINPLDGAALPEQHRQQRRQQPDQPGCGAQKRCRTVHTSYTS